ncbi:MAG: hypothetical protein CMB99_09315 [Flavobacteriaceae bacterium]|nr:hypothetical protein [Flavobacteriaceae bacterium]|tara:strand:+ start:473391 stop:475091 length:1701 start_codon:yes stop_codon:yes gene_type:complete
MNKKSITLSIMLAFGAMIFAQTQKTIKVIVPHKTDEVYITGNQESLGNWNPKSVKMERVSDYERSITTELTFPAEFKFTKGSWNQEGIVNKLYDNPNLTLANEDARTIYYIKGWSNETKAASLGLDYNLEFLPSKYVVDGRKIQIALPKNYNPKKPYPVLYITDGGTTNFSTTKEYLKILSAEYSEIVPEAILVGIIHGKNGTNSNRNKDLDVYYKTSGKNFKDFLFKELVPHINKNYSTSGFNVMIGHSNGAEYNHFLLLEKDNPFRAFLSISTNFFNRNVRSEMGDFMKNYDGKPFYYFVSTGTFDSPDRTEAGNDYEKIYNQFKNSNIAFQKRHYEKGHNSMVPASLFDGLQFIFKDYNNAMQYKTLQAYEANYIKDQKEIYGLELQYNMDHMDNFLSAIFDNNDEKGLDDYLAFVERYKLWKNHFMKEPGGLDAANCGNFYWVIGAYEKSATQYQKAFEQLAVTVEPAVFYYNHPKILESFRKSDQHNALMELLVESRNKLSANPQYLGGDIKHMLLKLNYEIAKLSSEKKLNRKEGKRALKYCKDNYLKNSRFTEKELNSL